MVFVCATLAPKIVNENIIWKTKYPILDKRTFNKIPNTVEKINFAMVRVSTSAHQQIIN